MKRLPKCVFRCTKESFNSKRITLGSNRANGQQWMFDFSVCFKKRCLDVFAGRVKEELNMLEKELMKPGP